MYRAIRLALLLAALTLLIPPCLADDANPWQGEWIWQPTPTRDSYFRRTIQVKEQPASAKLAITADNIYTLFINGVQVGHDEEWESLETYDIRKYVSPGRNVIAVHVTDPGPDQGGLLVEGSVNYEDDPFTLIKSDSSWRMYAEEKQGWEDLDFDDSGWAKPVSIGKPPVGPWGGIEHPELIPQMSAKITNLRWPALVEPGRDASISFTATADTKPTTNGPVILRLFTNGEKVWEHWMDPPKPFTEWEPGQPVTIEKAIPVPSYIPRGEMMAQIALSGMSGDSTFPVVIGQRHAKINPPVVQVTDLSATASGVRLDARATIKVLSGTPPPAGLYVQLYKGRELWYAETVRMRSSWKPGSQVTERIRVALPPIPGGTYELSICPHNTECRDCPRAPVTIKGGKALGQNAKPLGYGVFEDRNGVPHRWHISRNGVNIWDGKPYIPVGAMYLSTFFGGFNVNNPGGNERNFRNDVEKLKAMRDAGVTDLYLNPCCQWKDKPLWVWQRTADIFEEMGFNYGFQITQETGALKGFHVTTEQNNVPAPKSGTYGMEINSGGVHKIRDDSWAIYSVLDAKTGDLIASGKAHSAVNGDRMKVEADVTLAPGREAVVHFTPFVTFQGDMHDYWTNVSDKYFGELDRFVGGLKFGPGFRLIIDPLDNEQSWRDAMRMLPSPPAFREMLAADLKSKYETADRLTTAWSCTPALPSFEVAARLVPIGRASEKVTTGWAIDLDTDKTYRVNLKTSRMWYDMVSFRDWSVRDFNNLVADRIKVHHDVPVVLKLTDADGFTNDKSVGGFDGVGMEAYGSQVELIKGCGGGVYSRSRRAGHTIWELVTECGLAEDYVGYTDPLSVFDELGAMVSIGAKGTFIFYVNAGGDSPGQGFYIFNLFCDMRQLGWVGAFSRMMKTSANMVKHDPDTDYMFPGVIAGAHGFAPFDPGFSGTIPPVSIRGDSGKWIVPSTAATPSGERVIVNLEDSPASRIHSQALDRLLQQNEVVFVGHRRDLGTLSIDKYYTDKFAILPDGRKVQVLKTVPGVKVLGKTTDGKVYWMQVGNLTIYSKDDWQRSVREMAGPCKAESFIPDVLGCKVLDLGPAFQGITNGTDTFVWLLGDEPAELTVNAADRIIVFDNTGEPVIHHGPVKLSFEPKAQNTVRLMCHLPEFIGLDDANSKTAHSMWNTAREKALKYGVKVGPEPATWREAFTDAERMAKETVDAMRTMTAKRMTGVKIDGDLSEWSGVKPVYPAVQILRDFSRSGDFRDGEFFLGWDADNLYIAARIKDDSMVNNYRSGGIWNGDAIEAFIEIDPENDLTMHSYDRDTWQFLFSPTNADGKPDMAVNGNPGLKTGYRPQANRVAAIKTDDGWTIECAVNSAELAGWHPRAGDRIGFTFALDMGNSSGRQHQYISYGKGDITWNRKRLGRLRLVQ